MSTNPGQDSYLEIKMREKNRQIFAALLMGMFIGISATALVFFFQTL